jgi:hypothetical protein
MSDECDFDTTLRKMLDTPPQVHQRLSDQQNDNDDLDEPQEQDADGEEIGE